jgi:hypothetical protein
MFAVGLQGLITSVCPKKEADQALTRVQYLPETLVYLHAIVKKY